MRQHDQDDSGPITAQAFLRAFATAWEEMGILGGLAAASPYDSRRAWTDFMLGEQGVLARAMARLSTPLRRLEYRREIYTVDALFVSGLDLYLDGLRYPSRVLVLIEHELDSFVEEEMWKLLHWRAPLKVLMFYDWADSEKTRPARRTWLPEKLRKLASMAEAVANANPEDPATCYLFLIGQRSGLNDAVSWAWATCDDLDVKAVDPRDPEVRRRHWRSGLGS